MIHVRVRVHLDMLSKSASCIARAKGGDMGGGLQARVAQRIFVGAKRLRGVHPGQLGTLRLLSSFDLRFIFL